MDLPTPPLLLLKATTMPCPLARRVARLKDPVEKLPHLGAGERPAQEVLHVGPHDIDDGGAFGLIGSERERAVNRGDRGVGQRDRISRAKEESSRTPRRQLETDELGAAIDRDVESVLETGDAK